MVSGSFADIEALLQERITQMVWCNMATVDRRNRMRSRIVQPLWQGPIAWIASRRNGLKAKHIAHNPFVSLAYIGDNIRPVYIDGSVEWVDDVATKHAVWQLGLTTPDPLGFDFTPLYQSPDNPNFGVLKLVPWRIEIGNMVGAKHIWHATE